MKFKLQLIPPEGGKLEGSEPAAILDIQEPLFRFEEAIHYILEVNWVGESGLLVRGRLSTTVRAQCVRTLEWFDLPLVVEAFEHQCDRVHGDEVDLTQEIREDILLVLPANPVAPQAGPLKTGPASEPGKGSVAWGELDKLKLK